MASPSHGDVGGVDRYALACACQRMVWTFRTPEPDSFVSAVETILSALPSTAADLGSSEDWIRLHLLRGALTFHAAYHQFIARQECGFMPVALCAPAQPTPEEWIRRWAHEYVQTFERSHPTPPAIKAAALIRRDYRVRWTLEALCAEVATSRSALLREFEDTYGMSPHHYQARVRLIPAVYELRSATGKVEAAARIAGYAGGKDFNKLLRDATGLTVAEIRALSDGDFEELLNDRLCVPRAFESRGASS